MDVVTIELSWGLKLSWLPVCLVLDCRVLSSQSLSVFFLEQEID